MIAVLIGHLRQLRYESRWRSELARRFPTAFFESNVVVKGPLENLSLGERVIVQSGSVLHLGGMHWCQNTGSLTIGPDSVISPNCVVYAGGTGGVRIGSHFDCGPGVGIFASRSDFSMASDGHVFAPVEIGDRVIVFAHAVIGPGVVIGDNAVIAAGSVVTGDVPAHCLVGGAPAKVLRTGIRK